MAKPKNTANRTYVCQGRLHRNTDAHQVLQQRRADAGVLFNTALDELPPKHPGNTLGGNDAQLLATAVAQSWASSTARSTSAATSPSPAEPSTPGITTSTISKGRHGNTTENP